MTPAEGKSGAMRARLSAIILVGFMGAGKTSVGRALARRLKWVFEDLDDRIEKREGRSIGQIFRDSGEAVFRKTETAALREMLAEQISSRVVALGGGAIAQPENLEMLKAAGAHVIFLDASAEELFERCRRERRVRPMQGDAGQFGQLYESRRPLYLLAESTIDTSGKTIESVAAEVACSLGLE
jgi:shikimate kinase